ncbi:LysR substrate-binding domain-containing protein [Paenibacillus sp. LHD-117]|uniref:LysR substrate-binding domain-containing protein n=1 Tax=Paenibacillus sp. LHD-117 TaxID=3071412 RepID=UPI0027E0F936|nr:LysR substrate-binding domain-containing protein [Paenibacillus sp. LHD-117]MDQ6420606.1 LysR substrate-binding domain-containing protein [Paenibacillus sp. LHD-117]
MDARLRRQHVVERPDPDHLRVIAVRVDGLHEAITAVKAGYGANFVSSLVVREAIERGELSRVYVEGIQLQNSIAVCTRKDEPLSAAASRFMDLIRMQQA